jgi:hypothetical protein
MPGKKYVADSFCFAPRDLARDRQGKFTKSF